MTQRLPMVVTGRCSAQRIALRGFQTNHAGPEISENPAGHRSGFSGQIDNLNTAQGRICGIGSHGRLSSGSARLR